MKKGFKLEDSKGRKLRWDCHTLIQIAKSLKGQPPYSVFMPVDGADSSLWNTSEFAEPAFSRLVSALEQEPDDFLFSEMLELEDSIGPPYQKTWVLVNVPRLISSLENKLSELKQYDPGKQFPGVADYETELRNLKRRYRDGLPDVIDLYAYFGTEAVLAKLQIKMPTRADSPIIELCGRAGTKWGNIVVQFLDCQLDDRSNIYFTTKLRFILRDKKEEIDALDIPEFTNKKTRPLRPNLAYELFLALANAGGRIARRDKFDTSDAIKYANLEAVRKYQNLQKQKEFLSRALKNITGLESDPFKPYDQLNACYEIKMTLIMLDEDGETIQPRLR